MKNTLTTTIDTGNNTIKKKTHLSAFEVNGQVCQAKQ